MLTDYERELAIKEGHRNKAAADYFEPRSHLHNDVRLLNLFGAGFDRGWDAATAPLLARIAELEAENHNLNWALGTEGFDQMATPEEQAEHEKGHAEVMANIARMKAREERHDQLVPEGVDYLDHIAALTAQVEQAAQPVAVGRFTKFNGEWRESSCGIPLYTAPPKAVPPEPSAKTAWTKALEIRTSQGWELKGNAIPVLYTDTINGEQVCRDDVWLCTTAALEKTQPVQAQPSEAEKLMGAAGLCRRCAAPLHEQLPPDYMLAKLQMVMPLFQEARDVMPAISVVAMKLHGISPTLADRMDAAGTFSLADWEIAQPKPTNQQKE